MVTSCRLLHVCRLWVLSWSGVIPWFHNIFYIDWDMLYKKKLLSVHNKKKSKKDFILWIFSAPVTHIMRCKNCSVVKWTSTENDFHCHRVPSSIIGENTRQFSLRSSKVQRFIDKTILSLIKNSQIEKCYFFLKVSLRSPIGVTWTIHLRYFREL